MVPPDPTPNKLRLPLQTSEYLQTGFIIPSRLDSRPGSFYPPCCQGVLHVGQDRKRVEFDVLYTPLAPRRILTDTVVMYNLLILLVPIRRFELLTYALRMRRSTN